MNKLIAPLLLFLLNPLSVFGLEIPPVFSDHMVLQREATAPVWGTANPATEVTARLTGKANQPVATGSGLADARGRWRLELGSLDAGGPYTLTIQSGDKTASFQDVLVGEVWVGSGQSNMAGGVRNYAQRDATLEDLWKSNPHPKIRLLRGGAQSRWTLADEDSVGGFSAILFAFGEAIHRECDVPVGLILGAVGGTPSSCWLSEEAYAASPKIKAALDEFSKNYNPAIAKERWRKQMEAWEKAAADARAKDEEFKRRKPNPPQKPGEKNKTGGKIGGLYEKFIRPQVGYGIRGVLWDQGESGTGVLGLDQFTAMGALTRGWRREWALGEDFPFILIAKPSGGGCAYDPKNPVTREGNKFVPLPEKFPDLKSAAQRLEFLRMTKHPNVYTVPTSDLGSGVHPLNKWAYGTRAARLARHFVYGQKIPPHGPAYRSHESKNGKIQVHFDHLGGGLVTAHVEEIRGFAIAGQDGVYHWAKAQPDGDTILLSSDQVPDPVHAAYGCAKERSWANLFSQEGLPVSSFRTDPPEN